LSHLSLSDLSLYQLHTENLQRKIKQIQSEITELDKESSKLGQEIDIHRAKLGGVNAAQQNNAAIDKQIRVLENRLEKVCWLT
jgi:predicted RNase H-like nuclease (RuvC/YqgF family)